MRYLKTLVSLCTLLLVLLLLNAAVSLAGPSEDDALLYGQSEEVSPSPDDLREPVLVYALPVFGDWQAGSKQRLGIQFEVTPGHYVNQEMIVLKGVSDGFQPESLELPEPVEKEVASLGKIAKIYPKSFQASLPLMVAADLPAGPATLRVEIRYQACSQAVCFLPVTVPLEVPLQIQGPALAAVDKPAEKPSSHLRDEFVFAEDQPDSSGPQSSQESQPPVSLKLAGTLEPVAPGSEGVVSVNFHVEPGHYVNRDMTSVQPLSSSLSIGEARFPEPKKKEVPSLGKVASIYPVSFSVQVPVKVPSSLGPGMYPVQLKVRYQACSDKVCFIPTTETLSVDVAVGNAAMPSADGAPGQSVAVQAALARSAQDSAEPDSLTQQVERGWFYAFVFVFFGGILASLTPCVYPMIPITVAVIGTRGAESRWKGFTLSLFFVLGLALNYAILGVIAGATGSVFGWLLQNPWVIGGVSLVFVGLALGMFGFYDMAVPPAMANRLNQMGGSGYGGSFLVGMVTGVVASPCVGPVVVGILSWVATTAADPSYSKLTSLSLGFSLMFVFALGMGILFILIGTFSGVMASLPSSGAWMIRIKHLLGTTLLAVAWYFALPLMPVWLAPLILAPGLLVLASGELHGERSKKWATSFMAAGAGYLLLLLGSFVWPVAFPVGLVPVDSVMATSQGESVEWLDSESEGLEWAARDHKPIMIDFFADWCVACRELDLYTYSDAAVAEVLKGFVSVKIDGTDDSPEIQALYDKYGVRGLPTVLFLTSDGQPLAKWTLTGFEKPEAFLDRLASVQAALP